MPTYRNRCTVHGDWDAWQSIRDDSRPPCPQCGVSGKRVMVPPKISVYATPHKGDEVKRVDAADKRLEGDLSAYKALRRQGYQPKGIDGAAVLQRDATDPIDIAMGKKAFVDKSSYQKAREVNQALAENSKSDFASEMGKVLPRKVPA